MTKYNEMTVADLRKAASKAGIKNASKYRRVQLVKMLNGSVKSNAKAKRISDDQVSIEVDRLLGIQLVADDLRNVNRKVLIQMMKKLHCTKWYRTYDKPTMITKIIEAA